MEGGITRSEVDEIFTSARAGPAPAVVLNTRDTIQLPPETTECELKVNCKYYPPGVQIMIAASVISVRLKRCRCIHRRFLKHTASPQVPNWYNHGELQAVLYWNVYNENTGDQKPEQLRASEATRNV